MRNFRVVVVIFISVIVSWILFPDFSRADEQQAKSGVVKSVNSGVLYVSGIPHTVVVVDTNSGSVNVAVSSASVNPIKAGEPISFVGIAVTLDGQTIIDTTKGLVWRPAELSMAQYMAEMQKQAEAQMQAAAANGIPNAVQVMSVKTTQQEEMDKEAQRIADREKIINYIIALLTLVVGMMAVERLPKILSRPVSWIRSQFGKLPKSN